MKYNIYKTTNLVNGKFYWGVHDSTNENDGYLGSGTVLRKAINKHGKENFRRKTMVIYETAADAYFDEALLVTQKYIDENPLCYNVHPGGKGGSEKGRNNPNCGRKCPEQSKRLKIKNPMNDIDFSGKNNPMYGKPAWNKGRKTGARSEETKTKISQTSIANESHKGKNNGMFGKKHLEETKQIMRKPKSEEHRRKLQGQNNPNSRTNREKRALACQDNIL